MTNKERELMINWQVNTDLVLDLMHAEENTSNDFDFGRVARRLIRDAQSKKHKLKADEENNQCGI